MTQSLREIIFHLLIGHRTNILIPAGLPLVVTLVWVVSMELTDQGACWDDYSENNSIYIIVVPILSILMVGQLFPPS